MHKVLLVYDDYNELTITESYLKKIGFDVVGISKEIRIQEQILTFNPEVIVAYGKSTKVNSFSIAQKLKETIRYHGKTLIVASPDLRPSVDQMLRMKVDAMMEAPVEAEKLVSALCRLMNLPAEALLEKLQNAKLSDPELNQKMKVISGAESAPSSVAVSGTPGRIPLEDKVRVAGYDAYIKDVQINTGASSHSRQDIKDKQKELQKDLELKKLEALDEQKRKFVEALFKKS